MGCCNSSEVSPTHKTKNEQSPVKIADDLNITFHDLKHIDEHARMAPNTAEVSLHALANYLTKSAKDDIEMVRAFYVWICENVSYNVNAFFTGNSAATAAEDVLRCKTSVCEGYANLFLSLCLIKNIKCKKISGYSKGYGHAVGSMITYNHRTNHAWNVVFIAGKWRFVETTWGAGHVDSSRRYVKQFSNFYFFTRPQHFIADHFPFIENDKEVSKQWQLLKTPITLEEFSKALKLETHAREWGIEFPSHPFEIIDVKKNSSITMQAKQFPIYSASVKLHNNDGILCRESAVIIKNDGRKYTIMIRPKHTGKYNLAIYGSIEEGSKQMNMLTEFMINCTDVEVDHLPFPNHDGFYGPKSLISNRGFDISKLPSSFHTCKDGEYEIRIPTTKDIFMSASLHDADGIDKSEYILLEQPDGEVLVKTRFTQKGYHKLTLFSGLEENSSYDEALNILILNTNALKVQVVPFPKTFSSTIKYKCQLIEPLIRDIPANSDVDIKMVSSVLTELLVSGRVYAKDKNNRWNLTIKTAGCGNLQISGKCMNDSSYWGVYTFNIKS